MNLRNGATQRKMEKQRANRFKGEDTQRKIKYNIKKGNNCSLLLIKCLLGSAHIPMLHSWCYLLYVHQHTA